MVRSGSVSKRTGEEVAVGVTGLNTAVVEEARQTRALDGEEAVETVQVKFAAGAGFAVMTCASY